MSIDYSKAKPQTDYPLIPHNTFVKVCMNLIGGGYNDESKGWTGGWVTKSKKTDAKFLKVKFTIIGGKYDTRQVWSLIGLESEKNPKYAEMGESFIRAILESANGITTKDKTELANRLRRIEHFGELDGIEFVAKIEVQKDKEDNERNVVRYAITKGHPEYEKLMPKDNGRYKIGKSNKTQESNEDIEDDEIPF